jgi:hypothetical protein
MTLAGFWLVSLILVGSWFVLVGFWSAAVGPGWFMVQAWLVSG